MTIVDKTHFKREHSLAWYFGMVFAVTGLLFMFTPDELKRVNDAFEYIKRELS